MKSTILLLVLVVLVLQSMISGSPSRVMLLVVFIVGYIWVLNLIQSRLDKPKPHGRPDQALIPPIRSARPVQKERPFFVNLVIWFFRDVLGGITGLPVMRALVGKELRTMLASRKSFWLLFGLSLVTSGYFLIFWQNNSLSITVATRAQFSRRIFSALYLVQYCGLGLISAVMAAATVTTERENKTLDLLLATRLSREQVVLGKWFSNIIYQLVLLAALMPVQALAFQLGGVGLDDYLAAALLVVASICCYGMIGLAVSCHLQRTVPALLVSVGLSALVGLFVPAHRFFDMFPASRGPGSALMMMIPLGLAYIIAWRVAWHGLAHADTARHAIAKPVIDDVVVLKARRETWPYYLIDPLARPQDIADGQDPVFVKEQRVSPLGRPDTVIRMCYVAMFISFILIVSKGTGGSFAAFRFIASWEGAFLLVFVPVMAATGISKEYEENTIGLLRATPLNPSKIVLAKFRVSLRLFAIICLSLTIIPIAFYSGMTFVNSSMRTFRHLSEPLAALAKTTPLLVGWTALYAATSLLCSSVCRRNVTAIVASYATMLIGVASPMILGFLLSLVNGEELLGRGMAGKTVVAALTAVRRGVCPLLSPFDYFSAAAPPAHAFDNPESWLQIILTLALLFGAVVAILQMAKTLMLRAARRG